MQKEGAEMERRKVVKCGGKEDVWIFAGGREDFFAVLCCAALVAVGIRRLPGTTAGLLRTPIWSSPLAFMIHRLTVHSAGQVKRTKLPCVLLSCTALCFGVIEKLYSNSKLTSLTSSRQGKPCLYLIFWLLKCGLRCQNALLSELQVERVCHSIIRSIQFSLISFPSGVIKYTGMFGREVMECDISYFGSWLSFLITMNIFSAHHFCDWHRRCSKTPIQKC